MSAMTSEPTQPSDGDLDLERELSTLRDLLSARDAQIEILSKASQTKDQEIQRLREQVQALLARIYGRRSEKSDAPLDEEQARKATGLESDAPVDPAPDDEEEVESDRKKKKRVSRARKLRDLPRKRIEHDVSPEEKICACCQSEKLRFGETVTEELEYVPASVIVHEHVRPKYVCKKCESGIVTAELPPRMIDGGMPGPGMLAQIVTAKYADHLPLHRQEAIFERHGLQLSRQTMCDWIRTASELLDPIRRTMRSELQHRPVVHSDDTGVLMRTSATSKGCHKSHLFVWLTPEEDLVLYDFHLTNGQSAANEFLDDFRGEVLVADGIGSYNGCKERGIKRAGCWAHARRDVRDGMASHPKEASEIFVLIQMLYVIERSAKDRGFDAAARLELRKAKSKPILEEIRRIVDRETVRALPSSAFGAALKYLDNQWTYLTVFAEDGRIPIDNNAAERGMRPVTVGRKNWLFAGSLAGGKRAAILYSLIETCRRLDISPFEYLRDVLGRVSTHPASRIGELTPAGWKAAHAAKSVVETVESTAP